MIWYAVEILIVLAMVLGGVILYTFLIHSPAFARFLASLTTTPEESAEENLDSARESAEEILAQERREIKERAARAARLKKKL